MSWCRVIVFFPEFAGAQPPRNSQPQIKQECPDAGKDKDREKNKKVVLHLVGRNSQLDRTAWRLVTTREPSRNSTRMEFIAPRTRMRQGSPRRLTVRIADGFQYQRYLNVMGTGWGDSLLI
jgi:hypothetical protein